MEKIDWKRDLKHLYRPRQGKIVEVDVPSMRYLMIDGDGDPNNSGSYTEAVEALFASSYAAKFDLKKETGQDFVVMPLEGLWWADDNRVFEANQRSKWQWTMMIMQPPEATIDILGAAIQTVGAKKHLPGLAKVRIETLEEGRCAQTLHVGPFAEEGPAIQRLHDYICQSSALRGKHHEIYLSDIRRAKPENWRTVIRQPMA